MNVKKTMKLLFLALLFIGINVNAAEKNVTTVAEEVTLADFLNDISEAHEVFFTYNPNMISGANLNPEEYRYNNLGEIITKLEVKTKFDFEYLGNKYYVVHPKKVKRAVIEKVSAMNGLGFTTVTDLSILQNSVTGNVTDQDGIALAGVNIVEKGTSNGTTSDFDGNYTITAAPDATLVFSYIGFGSVEESVNGRSAINVKLSEGVQLEEFIVTGSRTAPRSNTDSPLPIDVISVKELAATGQVSFDKALQYRIPSFNTVQTPVNDATSLLDPYEIRNMGPSRTLILINGKRKNLSALLYTQTSPGRGETGADIAAIPTDAIKRVEILRDGASAQYGSDAIAGVMNIILKDTPNGGSGNIRSGISSEGDGEFFGVAINNGSPIAEDKGFVNYTVDISKLSLSNRPGEVSALAEADGAIGFGAPLADVQEFLDRNPDANNINGAPETAAAKFSVNTGYELSEQTTLYGNAAYVYKSVNSFANYRTPYWRTLDAFPYLADFFPGDNPNTENGYDGYLPTFEGLLSDYNATIGFKSVINDWNIDASFTTGGNQQTYKVNNSHNGNFVFAPSFVDANGNNIPDPGEGFEAVGLYRENSQQSFDPGGTRFTHNVGNIDVSKVVNDKISIGIGAEFRTENFEIIEGELASFDGGGADSFAGASPQNSGTFNRYNIGGYFSLDYDVTDDFLLSGTVRAEDYSDFGSASVFKVSSRYKVSKALTLRASLSSGFRAPTLHQIFTQKSQFAFVPGQGIQVGGLVNNVSTQAKLLGIPELDAETSNNFTAGFGGKIGKLNYTVDYYNIAVKDRIVLGTEIGASGDATNPLDILLTENNLSDISFFSNAIDTRTEGIDVVIGYRGIQLGEGKLDLNLSGNYTINNELDGEVNDIPLVANSGQSVFNDTQAALLFTSRPETKWILGANYDINKFGLSLNNTLFGKTTFEQQGLNSNLFTEFTPKVVTDLAVNYNATEKLTVSFNVNNIFDVLPEWSFKAKNAAGQAIIDDTTVQPSGLTQIEIEENLITFNGRYSQTTYDGSHFSQLGTLFNLSVNYKF